ncbi:MAG: hypothetical protein KDA41_11275 [Planctomycetales bacterium]|nr:hypothetical protein [Planctomycetales bacterium]
MPRKRSTEDILGSALQMAITAVLASAATIAVYLAVQTRPAKNDSPEQEAATAQQKFVELAASLEAFSRASLDEAAQSAAPTDAVHVAYHAGPDDMSQSVPLESAAGDMLIEAPQNAWKLEVSCSQARAEFVRVLDVRRATSLREPGFFGIVEVDAETQARRAEISGRTPFEPPQGFRVITTAEYNERQGAAAGSSPVRLASAETPLTFEWAAWKPTDPPPAELPPDVQSRLNETIVACLSAAPTTTRRKETRTYFYSLREHQWSVRP